MTEENTSVDVTEKVKALEKEYEALRSAMSRSRNIRLLILLGAVAMVVVIAVMLYSLVSKVSSKEYQDNLLKIAQERLEKNRDQYLKEVQTLVDKSAPVLKDAFYKQTKKDMPKYTEAFAKERDAFAKSVEEKLRKEVDEHYKGTLEKYEERLAKEFPELESPELREKAMQAIEQAFNKLVEKYYVDALAEGIQEIYGLWDDFPVAKVAGKEAPEDVLIGLLLEMVSRKIAN